MGAELRSPTSSSGFRLDVRIREVLVSGGGREPDRLFHRLLILLATAVAQRAVRRRDLNNNLLFTLFEPPN